jgi:hypothetical protein
MRWAIQATTGRAQRRGRVPKGWVRLRGLHWVCYSDFQERQDPYLGRKKKKDAAGETLRQELDLYRDGVAKQNSSTAKKDPNDDGAFPHHSVGIEQYQNIFLQEEARFVERSLYKERTGSLPVDHHFTEIKARNRLHEYQHGIAVDMSVPVGSSSIVRSSDPIIIFQTGTRVVDYKPLLLPKNHFFDAQSDRVYDNEAALFTGRLGFEESGKYKKKMKKTSIISQEDLEGVACSKPRSGVKRSMLQSMIKNGLADEECCDSDEAESESLSEPGELAAALPIPTLTTETLLSHTLGHTPGAPREMPVPASACGSSRSARGRGLGRPSGTPAFRKSQSFERLAPVQEDALSNRSRSRSPSGVSGTTMGDDDPNNYKRGQKKGVEHFISKMPVLGYLQGLQPGRFPEWAALCQTRTAASGDAPMVSHRSDQA